MQVATPPVSPLAERTVYDSELTRPWSTSDPVMEHHDPSRRQYVPNTYSTQQPQQAGVPAQGQYNTSGYVDRFRQSSYLQQSQTSATPTGRLSGDGQHVYGFPAAGQYGSTSAMQSGQMQYGQEMQTPETPRHQTQQYPSYGANVVYGVPQTQATQSPYEHVSQYRQRANTGSETLPSQFGVPQTQYYLAGQAGQPGAAPAELAAQGISPQYQQSDPYQQAGSSSTQYPGTLMDPTQQSVYGSYGQQPQYPTQQHASSTDQAFERYQSQIRNVFSLVQNGNLRDIGALLMQLTQYLLGNVETLGLARDEEALHDDRIRLWDEFNRAWLTTLQRQFDLTQNMIQTGNTQSIMDVPTLERLSQELVRLCDSIERHGLVDYQMGVSEEEIMDLMLRCLSLLRPGDERASESAAQAESSTIGASRAR